MGLKLILCKIFGMSILINVSIKVITCMSSGLCIIRIKNSILAKVAHYLVQKLYTKVQDIHRLHREKYLNKV